MAFARPLIRPDADSVIGERMCSADGGSNSKYLPLFGLVWIFWLFATPLFSAPGTFPHWLWPTLASFVMFLVFYLAAYYRSRRGLAINAAAIAVLGYALMAWNPGSVTYLIYACALFAFAAPPLRALALMALVLLPYALIGYRIGMPWPFVLSMVVMGMAIGGSNVAYRATRIKDEQLRLSHDEIRRLAAQAERERIGRDLHDLLGHTLSLIALKSELAGKLLARDPQASRREIGEVERTAREALAQVRSAVTGMRAAGLAGEIASARMMLECVGVEFSATGFERAVPAPLETCLGLVLREAATNIQRHAEAKRARIGLTVDGEALVLRVDDDGRGVVAAHGNGLNGMRERVEAQGGSLQIAAVRGQGTTLIARLPLDVKSAEVIALDAVARKARA